MPRRGRSAKRTNVSAPPQSSEHTDPEPVSHRTVAPFPRDSAGCVWALESFRQRTFSYLSRTDQVRAMRISKGSYPQAIRARFHQLDVAIYEDVKPGITHPDRLWLFRQAVHHLNCSNFPLHLPDGSTLSRLLCTFPNVSRIADDDERVFNLQGQGGRHTGVELFETCTVDNDRVTGATGHLVVPQWFPVDWEITWVLTVIVQIKNRDRKLYKKLEDACRNRQGVWGHRIQTLTINRLPLSAFAALFGALLEDQNPAPSSLLISIDGYSYQDIQSLGSITSGHVRTVGIIAPLNPDSSMAPDLLEDLDWSTFRGVENFLWVIGEHSFAPPLGFDHSAPVDQHPGISISAASALSQLLLRRFPLQVDSGHDSSPIFAHGPRAGPIFILSKLARSMLAIGGSTCLYTLAPGPDQSGDERVQHFYEDLTSFVRAEMAHLVEEQARGPEPGWWKSG